MRVAASVVVTVLAAMLLAGCQFITPQQTARGYTPSDGVNGSTSDVQIRNVFLVAGEGDSASLIGVLSNKRRTSSPVTVQWTGANGPESQEVVVPAGGLLSMSTMPGTIAASVPGASTKVVLQDVKVTPGGLFRVSFVSANGSLDLRLPVLTGNVSQYATLVPTPTPTVTLPTATDSPAVPTPTPTDTLAG